MERREGREKQRERNSNVQEIHESVVSYMLPTGDLTGNLTGICPNQESNQQPFGLLHLLSHTSQGKFFTLLIQKVHGSVIEFIANDELF